MPTVYKSVDVALIHPRIGTSMSILLLLIFGVSRADAQPFAYVANNNDSTVCVINTATNAVVATIATKCTQPHSTARNQAKIQPYHQGDHAGTPEKIHR